MSAESICRDTCDIYRATETASWSGQPVKTFALQTSNVPCRKIGEYSQAAFANREGVVSTPQFVFPRYVDVLESDEILHNARRYSITALDSNPGSGDKVQVAAVKEVRP